MVDTDIAPFAEKRTRKWKSVWCCGCRGGDGLTCVIGTWLYGHKLCHITLIGLKKTVGLCSFLTTMSQDHFVLAIIMASKMKSTKELVIINHAIQWLLNRLIKKTIKGRWNGCAKPFVFHGGALCSNCCSIAIASAVTCLCPCCGTPFVSHTYDSSLRTIF